eukprot:CAMPEP_0174300144 /NCGR_PEP_ID=MMETSP0809-20121228/58296_1 /TAXON_ID=73025 ORGANISM="Eutreptiella gymnastica-like, Strain CCMP1594" /NCGR_SAMPLE_ID=MMETSP0809 /ASSEMBLY_ACC=CAM_ASM_000658 /LENGTH=405 /DNA_ID=CAMNT_0015405685 /DNA_START=16 /DNA_END=1232 /DNA_ORIENTATION=-
MTTLHVLIREAKDLPEADKGKKGDHSDPYVKIEVGKEHAKTKTVKDNLNPRWDESFTFNSVSASEIRFKVYDDDKLRDDHLCEGVVPLHQRMPYEGWVPLSTKKHQNAGSLLVRIDDGSGGHGRHDNSTTTGMIDTTDTTDTTDMTDTMTATMTATTTMTAARMAVASMTGCTTTMRGIPGGMTAMTGTVHGMPPRGYGGYGGFSSYGGYSDEYVPYPGRKVGGYSPAGYGLDSYSSYAPMSSYSRRGPAYSTYGSSSLALDAADGVVDGTFYGRPIAPSYGRPAYGAPAYGPSLSTYGASTYRRPAYGPSAALSLDAADGVIDGAYFGSPIMSSSYGALVLRALVLRAAADGVIDGAYFGSPIMSSSYGPSSYGPSSYGPSSYGPSYAPAMPPRSYGPVGSFGL